MLTHLLFTLMLSFFIVHELDAVLRHEWRVMPVMRRLRDPLGRQVFIWAHVPILMAIFWWIMPDPNALAGLFLSAFAVVHVGLHWLFRKHPANEFDNPSSRILITCAGLFGALHFLSVTLAGPAAGSG